MAKVTLSYNFKHPNLDALNIMYFALMDTFSGWAVLCTASRPELFLYDEPFGLVASCCSDFQMTKLADILKRRTRKV